MLRLKRVYEEPSPADGFRVLVERLWPRGLTKERAAVDLWLKDVAPSPELRKWFGHDPARWEQCLGRVDAALGRRHARVPRPCVGRRPGAHTEGERGVLMELALFGFALNAVYGFGQRLLLGIAGSRTPHAGTLEAALR